MISYLILEKHIKNPSISYTSRASILFTLRRHLFTDTGRSSTFISPTTPPSTLPYSPSLTPILNSIPPIRIQRIRCRVIPIASSHPIMRQRIAKLVQRPLIRAAVRVQIRYLTSPPASVWTGSIVADHTRAAAGRVDEVVGIGIGLGEFEERGGVWGWNSGFE